MFDDNWALEFETFISSLSANDVTRVKLEEESSAHKYYTIKVLNPVINIAGTEHRFLDCRIFAGDDGYYIEFWTVNYQLTQIAFEY